MVEAPTAPEPLPGGAGDEPAYAPNPKDPLINKRKPPTKRVFEWHRDAVLMAAAAVERDERTLIENRRHLYAFVADAYIDGVRAYDIAEWLRLTPGRVSGILQVERRRREGQS